MHEPRHDSASYLILMTVSLATLSIVLFLLTVVDVPGEALFALVVGLAATRRLLWRRGADMRLTARLLTIPHARSRRRVQPTHLQCLL